MLIIIMINVIVGLSVLISLKRWRQIDKELEEKNIDKKMIREIRELNLEAKKIMNKKLKGK